MTDLKNNTARIALAAMLAAAPLGALADVETGSPAQSVESDPNEYAEDEQLNTESVAATDETGTPAQSVDADVREEVAASDDENRGTIADELPTDSPAVEG